jgi:hypothetical protein
MDSSLLEQQVLRDSMKKLGVEKANDAYIRFHVLYGEKHKRVELVGGHNSVLMKLARNYYDARSEFFKRYMSINFGVRSGVVEEHKYIPSDYRKME